MRKNIRKMIAWLLLSGIVVTSSGLIAVAETKTIAQNPLAVSEQELANGTAFVLTAKMLSEDGTIKQVVVTSPQLEVVDYDKIMALLESGMEVSKVADLNKEYQQTKEKLETLYPTIKTNGETEIGTIQVFGSVNLQLSEDNIKRVSIEKSGNHTSMKVTISDYAGIVSVNQSKEEESSWNLLHLTLENSALKELKVTSTQGCVCSINKKGISNIEYVEMTSNAKLYLSVPTDKLAVSEKAEDAYVKLYTNVKDIVVEGKQSDIYLTSAARVENATIHGDNTRIYGFGTLESAEITGEKANVSIYGAAVEGENDKTIPLFIVNASSNKNPVTITKPTAKPTTTPKPTVTVTPTVTPTPEGTPSPEKPEGTVKNEYDANGNIIKKIYYDKIGNIKFYSTYEYYTNGNVKQITDYNANNIMLGYRKYSEESKIESKEPTIMQMAI